MMQQPQIAGTLGLRLGTVAMTTRGVDAEGFGEIGNMLAELLIRGPSGNGDQSLRKRVAAQARRNPVPDFFKAVTSAIGGRLPVGPD